MNSHSRRSRDKPFVTATRAVSPLSGLGFGLCAVALSALAPQAASAQGRLDAQYEATLAGIPVGKGAWTIEIGDDTFSAAAQGGTAGLLKAFSGGTGSGASQGRIVGGALVPNAYTATTTTQKKSETIRLVLANGNVKDFDRSGAAGRSGPGRRHRRAPQKRARSHDRLDAARAGQCRAAVPDSCRTAAGIFDGRLRYDLKLDYKRMEKVKAEKGYHGPGAGLRHLFHAGGGLYSRPPGDQISRHPAQDRGHLRADRGNPRAGAIPHDGADPVRPRDAGSDLVPNPRRAAQGGEDELSLGSHLAPLFAGRGRIAQQSG